MIGTTYSEHSHHLQSAIDTGLFNEALALLDRGAGLTGVFAIEQELLLAELSLELGDIRTAQASASNVLRSRDAPLEFVARSHRVLSNAAFYRGELKQCADHLDEAKARLGKPEPSTLTIAAHLELLKFSLSCRMQPLEVALAQLPGVRRLITRAGNAHLLILLRIAVARIEIRRRSAAEASRHHDAALDLCSARPNLWLEGLIRIDVAAGAMLRGDIDHSIEQSRLALERAQRSGHYRTRIAASINMAQALEMRGELDQSRTVFDKILKSAAGNKHLVRAALDGLANLYMTQGDQARAGELLAEAEKSLRDERIPSLYWDAITELNSQARFAQMQLRWDDARGIIDQALAIAASTSDTVWSFRLSTDRARCLAMVGATTEATSALPARTSAQVLEPELLSRYDGAVAAIQFRLGRTEDAAINLGRAVRVSRHIGNNALSLDLCRGFSSPQAGPTPPAPATLDSAVALLELAGHPHILGREAFAILEGAGCCAQLALLAAGPTTARAVAVAGWTEAEAVTAFASARPEDITVLGPYRDDTWQLLVRPGPDLDDHCTVAAVRKVVDTARTLDRYRRDEQERNALWPAESLDGDPESIWISEQSIELLSNARRIASNPLPVLITGETGTGKEMLARAIHRASQRAERPLQAFNCSAVPRDMLESQLFGHKRGAFTGADTASPGVIRAAAGGTLFLDEIAELNLELQPKLLRFLDRQEIHPLGEPHPITVDVKVIAATNADLERLVADGRFREDLFHRLNVIPLRIPPLRERREEIPPLVEHYLRRVSVEQKKGNLSISDEVLEYLVLYNWPGNIRQLANEVRRMVAFADRDSTLTPALLSPEILASRRTIPASSTEPEIRLRLDQPLPSAVDQLEQTMVRHALEQSHGRVEEAARLLGISRKGLFLKRRRWGLREAS